ncbi:MAG: SpoIID/LytB domain-containing protein [Marinilabiliaceae bacterium]|jgi:stage II sporulation protein D|nr:SpoIID/LytB domain-containing protein [Marinilabiliaceae bacterium]
MLIRSVLIILLSLLSLNLNASFRVRLFYGNKYQTALVRIESGQYRLEYNNEKSVTLGEGELILLTKSGDRVAVNRMSGPGILADSVRILSLSDTSFVNIRIPGAKNEEGEYRGDFVFSSSLEVLKIINCIDEENYIAGVVQAEGGYRGHPEYFKTQAIIARTYAWLHINRHADEGYHLCDDVHCQVYHGRSVTAIIDSAVRETGNLVITDKDSLLILTPFHSNCGGQTVSSGDVWLSDLPYLKLVYDPYCSYSANAEWEDTIKLETWLSYLQSHGYTVAGTSAIPGFEQKERMSDYSIGNISIPLTAIRKDFGLRSTFFSFSVEGDILHLKGRGYGHGVGLCQEGAMVMAKRGFKAGQIINFYYNSVIITDIDSTRKNKEEKESF